MKTSLDHLPDHKQQELEHIVRLIRDTLAEFRASDRIHGKGKYAKPAADLKDPDLIILFGSYARDEQVDDEYVENDVTYTYRSDFDILVVMETCKMARDFGVFRRVAEQVGPTSVRIIAHTPKYVNEKIDEGQYLFIDIYKEGIVLYDSKRVRLADPRKLEPGERRAVAEKYFKIWSALANEFLIDFQNAFDRGSFKIAAFYLHQAAEHLYGTILLVFTNYKPKSHNIEELSRQAANLDGSFMPIFPRATEEERRLFQLLKAAYIDARYDDEYVITKEDLDYLAARVRLLRDTTKTVCAKKIASF